MAESSSSQVTPSTIEELAGVAGLPLSPERRAGLAPLMQTLIEAVRAMDALDLSEVEPAIVFDARWET
jgi:hypothetical protein